MFVTADGACRYTGDIQGVNRRPQSPLEHLWAAATFNNEITEWVTTVSHGTCVDAAGRIVRSPGEFVLRGGPELHAGDQVRLHSVN